MDHKLQVPTSFSLLAAVIDVNSALYYAATASIHVDERELQLSLDGVELGLTGTHGL